MPWRTPAGLFASQCQTNLQQRTKQSGKAIRPTVRPFMRLHLNQWRVFPWRVYLRATSAILRSLML